MLILVVEVGDFTRFENPRQLMVYFGQRSSGRSVRRTRSYHEKTFWYVSNGVSKEFFEALLQPLRAKPNQAYAEIILLMLDNAG